MLHNVTKESPWDLDLKQTLITFYRDLVETQINDPVPLCSSFLGVTDSQKLAEDLKSTNRLIPSLGSSGIFEDGIPFYHLHTQTLSSDENRRLEENNVRLKFGHFSATEDEQIKENWHSYCDYSGADPSEAPSYMGCAVDRSKKKGSKYFRTWMCRGLPDRSGIQVYRRAQVLFHPSTFEEGLSMNRPWTKEEIQLLMALGPSSKWADIGARLNRPRFHCHKEYQRLLELKWVTGEEETDNWKLFYRSISKAMRKDPVKAFVANQLDALGANIDWEKIGEIMSYEAKRCRKLFKKLKRTMVEAKGDKLEASTELEIKKIRRGIPKACRTLCRLQNKKRTKLTIKPKSFSRLIKDLCAHHEDEIRLLQKPYRFAKTFIATEAFPEYDEKGRLVILKRLNFIVSTFEERGVFDFLPAKNRDLWTKLRLVTYVTKKVYYTRIKTARVFELAKHFIEKQGWESQRNAFAYKLQEPEVVSKPKRKPEITEKAESDIKPKKKKAKTEEAD